MWCGRGLLDPMAGRRWSGSWGWGVYLVLPQFPHRIAARHSGRYGRRSGHPQSPRCIAPPPGMMCCCCPHPRALAAQSIWLPDLLCTGAWAPSVCPQTRSCWAGMLWRGRVIAGWGWQIGMSIGQRRPSGAPSVTDRQGESLLSEPPGRSGRPSPRPPKLRPLSSNLPVPPAALSFLQGAVWKVGFRWPGADTLAMMFI